MRPSVFIVFKDGSIQAFERIEEAFIHGMRDVGNYFYHVYHDEWYITTRRRPEKKVSLYLISDSSNVPKHIRLKAFLFKDNHE